MREFFGGDPVNNRRRRKSKARDKRRRAEFAEKQNEWMSEPIFKRRDDISRGNFGDAGDENVERGGMSLQEIIIKHQLQKQSSSSGDSKDTTVGTF